MLLSLLRLLLHSRLRITYALYLYIPAALSLTLQPKPYYTSFTLYFYYTSPPQLLHFGFTIICSPLHFTFCCFHFHQTTSLPSFCSSIQAEWKIINEYPTFNSPKSSQISFYLFRYLFNIIWQKMIQKFIPRLLLFYNCFFYILIQRIQKYIGIKYFI